MAEKRRIPMPAVGGSSLLVIFAELCLTVFALLALSSVQAGSRLSDRSAQAVLDYYQADSQAEAILARLRRGEIPPDVEAEGDGVYSYACPISDTQTLLVRVRVEGTSCTVLRWQAASTAQWEAEEDLEVWDGT